MAVVVGILNEHFMRADRVHLVVYAIATAAGLALNVVKRFGMHYGARRPGSAGIVRGFGDLLKACKVGTKTTWCIEEMSGITWFVARHDPGTGDGVFAQFHSWSSRRKENTCENMSQPAIRAEISTRSMRNHKWEPQCALL